MRCIRRVHRPGRDRARRGVGTYEMVEVEGGAGGLTNHVVCIECDVRQPL
jgi:hypothetical protein